jgi:hypothetical protein
MYIKIIRDMKKEKRVEFGGGGLDSLEIGDYVVFDGEKARIDNIYTSKSGKKMVTLGSSKQGTVDVEAEELGLELEKGFVGFN